MAHNGFRVLDSDIHVIEPPDLWERYIDAPFKHQAPRGFAEHVLDLRLEIQGKRLPDGVAYQGRARGRGAERDRERFRTFHERGWSAEVQLEAMDAEGIDVGVVYPTRGLYAQAIDGRSRSSRQPSPGRTTTGSTTSARSTPRGCWAPA